jgi:pyruvate/2-oxoglutarate dehydrogenase complex dihydrolipoamide dehydrogenase (E3) component
VVVVGAGPAGLAAAAEAAAAGHFVTILERRSEIGGQVAIAGRAPVHEELAWTLRRNYEQLLARSNVELRLGVAADLASVEALEADAVIVATGAAPYRPRLPLDGVRVVQAWDVLVGELPEGRVVVADWGGDSAGLDCAELLHAAGREVVLAVGAVLPGDGLHQYLRNVYLQRISRLGIRIEHHQELVSAARGSVRLRNVFATELEQELPADALALSLGRVPEDSLGLALAERGLRVEEVGDCRSPRSIEEAILEGTLAAAAIHAPLVGVAR